METKIINFKDIKTKSYTITEYGEVYSLLTNKLLYIGKDKDGYLECTFQKENGKRCVEKVHRIVAQTFLGNPPPSMIDPTVNHKDENIYNNHYTNLEYLERGINSSIRTKRAFGESNGQSVLTENEVIEICNLIEKKEKSITEIALIYKVNKGTISNIKRKKKWIHVSKNYNWNLEKIKNKKEIEDQKMKILELFRSGKNIKEIVILGFPRTTVTRYYEKFFTTNE